MPVDYGVFGFCTMPCGQVMYRLATGPLPGSLEAARGVSLSFGLPHISGVWSTCCHVPSAALGCDGG